MKRVTKKTKKIFNQASRVIKDTATSSGLVDRKEIVIASHRKKCLHRAFWLDQVQNVREIQTTLQHNYNESKILLCFCCCRKEDLKTMIEEAVDDFHALPRQVKESGREVPITADTDINTVNLDQFKSHIPRQQYYDEREVGQLEREKQDLKADIVDLMREHRKRYDALQTLSDQHRHMRIQNQEPSTEELKFMIKAAFYLNQDQQPVSETSHLLAVESRSGGQYQRISPPREAV